MDKPISVGDLVMVVRWAPRCQHVRNHIGKVGRVLAINHQGIQCPCGAFWLKPGLPSAATDILLNDEGHWPLSWLRRIDPLTEPESITTDEGVTA